MTDAEFDELKADLARQEDLSARGTAEQRRDAIPAAIRLRKKVEDELARRRRRPQPPDDPVPLVVDGGPRP